MKKFIIIFLLLLINGRSISVEAQVKRALLIGISDYGNPRQDVDKWLNISGANDVTLLVPFLKKQNFLVSSLTNRHATYKNIKNAMTKLISDCKNKDIVYIHFSMHGQPFEDINGDEADGWDEALIPFDAEKKFKHGIYEGERHFLDDELTKYIDKIRLKVGREGMVYVAIDACHSGESSRGDDEHIRGVNIGFTMNNKEYKPRRDIHTNTYFKIKPGEKMSQVVYLEACRSYQYNRELFDRCNKKWYGPLSYYIAQIIKHENISYSIKWIFEVKEKMDMYRPNKQNMVIESSINNLWTLKTTQKAYKK